MRNVYIRIPENLVSGLADNLDIIQSVAELEDPSLKEWICSFIESPDDYIVNIVEAEKQCNECGAFVLGSSVCTVCGAILEEEKCFTGDPDSE